MDKEIMERIVQWPISQETDPGPSKPIAEEVVLGVLVLQQLSVLCSFGLL